MHMQLPARAAAFAVTSDAIVDASQVRSGWLARITKRGVDVVAALIILFLAWPFFLVIAAAVAIDGGKVFYGHRRVGLDGKTFDCLKFRTMIPGAEECLEEYLSYHPDAERQWRSEQKLAQDPRITPIGSLLRQWSLDELPQLINVLRGEMSLVGPRPSLPFEVALYEDWHRWRLEVRPGMTGLWQVSGRSAIRFEDMVRLDIEYIEQWSPLRDLLIMLRTVPALFRSETG